MAGDVRGAVLLFFLAAPTCEQAPVPPTKVQLRVTTSRGAAVPGAQVRVGESIVALSDSAGLASVVVGGREGETFELRIECPEPLRSPGRPIVIRRLDIQGGAVEHAVKCEETRRTLVVAVRAENGPDLPILYLGREIGRTDPSGVANVKIDADVRERVELALSTESEEMVGVHPQNPVAVFEPTGHDEVREFAVTFKRDAKRKPLKVTPRGPRVF